MNKSRQRVEQDYARNAIADGNTKAGKYEAKMAVKEASGESPAKMYGKKKGSPAHNQNKGYESVGQERKNLMQDNPIASHVGGSWMSKHSMAGGSPAHMGGSYKGSPAHQAEKPDPKTLINADGESQEDVMNSRKSTVEGFRNKIKDLKFNTEEQVDRANSIDLKNVNAFNKSNDSIQKVNTNYNKKVKTYNDSINAANANIDSILGGGK